MTDGRKLPAEWDATDHALFDAKIRQGMTWREVGEHVDMSFSAARQRFYRRMAAVTPAEIDALRTEENLKCDERERHLLILMAQARAENDWGSAISAIRVMDNISRSRRALNGLDLPPKQDPAADPKRLNELFEAYLQGHADADGHDRV